MEGGGADEAAPPLAQADARRDFTKPPMAGRRALRSMEVRRTGEGRGNRPAAGAGREAAKGSGPGPRPERVPGEASAEQRIRESGQAFGRRRDPKGDRKGFGLDASLWRRRGPGRAGSAKGCGGGPHGFATAPYRAPNGASRLAAVSGESGRGVRAPPRSRSRPARDGLATQRRQSKLGQVGAGGDTGPHYIRADAKSGPGGQLDERSAAALIRAAFMS